MNPSRARWMFSVAKTCVIGAVVVLVAAHWLLPKGTAPGEAQSVAAHSSGQEPGPEGALSASHAADSAGGLAALSAIAKSDAAAPKAGAPQAASASGESDGESADFDYESKVAAMNQLKKIPGAAPLVDELLAAFKEAESEDQDSEAPDESVDEREQARRDQQAEAREARMQHVWQKLMVLVAQHPEITGAKKDDRD